jgi:nicotinate-nucleotide adenylyltransferase
MTDSFPDQQAPDKTIGILGGTFDPIHHGHLHYGQQIAEQLGLSQVILMPAHIPPHKNKTHANSSQRLKMVELACKNNPIFACDPRELTVDKPSYSFHSLSQLRAENPQAKLFFFIGMDSLLNLNLWYRWQELLDVCHLVVTERPGYCITELTDELRQFIAPRLCQSVQQLHTVPFGKVYLASTDKLEISSSAIRQRISTGLNCQYLLPEAVLEFIDQEKLYQ